MSIAWLFCDGVLLYQRNSLHSKQTFSWYFLFNTHSTNPSCQFRFSFFHFWLTFHLHWTYTDPAFGMSHFIAPETRTSDQTTLLRTILNHFLFMKILLFFFSHSLTSTMQFTSSDAPTHIDSSYWSRNNSSLACWGSLRQVLTKAADMRYYIAPSRDQIDRLDAHRTAW